MPEISQANLSGIENALKRISNVQDQLSNRVDGMALDQKQTKKQVVDLFTEFHAYRLADERDKRVQRAEVKIIDVRMRLDNEFGHYAELRRLATGVVQAVDTGTVTEDTIQTVTEQVMTTTPGYWLAPALVGLGAGSR